NAVVKAERCCNGFSRWTAPLPLTVTYIAMGLLALKPTQFFFGLVFLPAKFNLPFFVRKQLLTNDKVVEGVQNADSACVSVFLFHWIVQGNRRVGLVPKLQDERIVLHLVDSCKLNRAALSLNDHSHFSTRIANGNILPPTANTPRRGRGANMREHCLCLAGES